jgi:hypothetical protein
VKGGELRTSVVNNTNTQRTPSVVPSFGKEGLGAKREEGAIPPRAALLTVLNLSPLGFAAFIA